MGVSAFFTGCVPSKTLIEAAATGMSFTAALTRVHHTIERIAATETADVLRGEGINVIKGRARFIGAHTVTVNGRRLQARGIVVAAGTTPLLAPIRDWPTALC